MLARLHLVRHGEVHNPGGVVYADLPGFPLSSLGCAQAAAAAEHLAGCGASVLATSPLDRARETAGFIAARLGLVAEVVPGLTEWGLSMRWAGEPWLDLDRRFPGELAAYAVDPADLPFSPESLAEVARRTTAVVDELGRRYPGAIAVLVLHQDPIHALHRSLCGIGFENFHVDKPVHAAVITLEPGVEQWIETASWAPDLPGLTFPPPTASPAAGR